MTAVESSIATILNHQYHQLCLTVHFTPVDPGRTKGIKHLFLSVRAFYFTRTHKDKSRGPRTPPHTCTLLVIRIYSSCWETEWSVCFCVYVCFSAPCLLLRQLARVILQEWTVTFDSITADWIGSPPAAGWLPSAIPSSDTAKATYCRQSPLLTPPTHPLAHPSTSPAPADPSEPPLFSSSATLCFS